MKKNIALIILIAIITIIMPSRSLAAGGMYASGGGTKTVGDTFTITVSASGATFDTFDGKISVSGPVSIVSFSPGNATVWLPSAGPSNGNAFTGSMLRQVTSVTVATIKLKATGVGSGAVSVSGVLLQSSGTNVGTGAGSASFTIQKAPDLPGGVAITSPSHPDQATAYEATTIVLNWDKASGVDGFSYLLDQTDGTTPPTKVTDAATTVTFADKAVGTYFFHIKAHKADGFGPVSQFKITIKEPDPKINTSLAKPHEIKIEKGAKTVNNISTGTFSGILIDGLAEPEFVANLTFEPKFDLPADKTLSATADKSGKFSLLLDFPIKAGTYKLTIQGQNNKILTPVSDPVIFEVSQVKGGAINLLTDADNIAPEATTTIAPKWYEKTIQLTKAKVMVAIILLGILVVLAITAIVVWLRRKGNLRKIAKSIRVDDIK